VTYKFGRTYLRRCASGVVQLQVLANWPVTAGVTASDAKLLWLRIDMAANVTFQYGTDPSTDPNLQTYRGSNSMTTTAISGIIAVKSLNSALRRRRSFIV
jgi:hypothetical protein